MIIAGFQSQLPSSSRKSRPLRSLFPSERHLVASFEELLRTSRIKGRTGFLREFDCGSGIADFILYTLHPNFSSRLLIGQVHPRYLFALRNLPLKKNFTEMSFARKVLASRERARDLLKTFSKLGFCAPTKRRNIWRKVRQPQPVLAHLCAVEAKLTDWNRALRQANRYCEFADQAWVLLDHMALRAALLNLEIFVRMNIGLAGINSDLELDIHFAPEIRKPRNPSRYWQANAQIASTLASRLNV